MTLFELLFVVAIIAGAVCGGFVGAEHFGVFGAIAGVPVGGLAGFVIYVLCTMLLVCVVYVTLRIRDPEELRKHEDP